MKDSIRQKLEITSDRMEEISYLLSDPAVISDQNKFRTLSQEYSQIEPIINIFNKYKLLNEDLIAAEEMKQDEDAAIQNM